MGTMTGRCLCGAVTFEADAVETGYHACHCGMCRRWSGGPLLAARVGGVTFAGEDAPATHASSEWAERGFCRRCGSSLFYRLRADGGFLLAVGAFDDQTPFTLDGEIFVDHKPAGYAFAGEHPRLSEEETMALFAGEARNEPG